MEVEELNKAANAVDVVYSEDNIRQVTGMAHVRMRPGMYIGKLGDGSHADDGIYVLVKEILDNSIDEFRMKKGSRIDIEITEGAVTVRDYGRGIPLGKVKECVSDINTSGKFDDKSFKKSVGLNGVGSKAVNALSEKFVAQSFRDGETRRVEFSRGELVSDSGVIADPDKNQNGTYIYFKPDNEKFVNYQFREEIVIDMLRNYSFLNAGLSLNLNGKRYYSKSGLAGLLQTRMSAEPLYPIINIKGEDIEIAITHCNQNGEEYYSFVNGQYTIQGGTHQAAFREAIGKTIREYYKKNMDLADIRQGIVAAIAVDVQEPEFESQTKIKLGSKYMAPVTADEEQITVNKFVNDFVGRELDNYLHREKETSDIMLAKIQQSEKMRKDIASLSKEVKEKTRRLSVLNPKLRDCRYHLNDTKKSSKNNDEDYRLESSIFITEGNSASGSLTKSRDANVQAVFSLRGKPKNSYGVSKKKVYENDELNFLISALNIDDGLDGLRYNKVIIATDADVDGMHIRLLMLTFFLQYYPDLVKKGHVYILQTPLFRVCDKKRIIYCYNEDERDEAVKTIGSKAEITRFKGLGEVNPEEFKRFFDEGIKLDQVELRPGDKIDELLAYYMGENTIERQKYIISNLREGDD